MAKTTTTKEISTRDRFVIGFISSMFLPFIKLYQNGGLLEAAENHYFLGLVGPFIFLGFLMGVYAWVVENSETDTKRLFRTCFAMPGVLLSLLGTSGEHTSAGVAKAAVEARQIVCERQNDAIQGLIDTYDALTNNHRYRYLKLSEKQTLEYVIDKGRKFWVLGKFATKPDQPGNYYDLRKCKTFSIAYPDSL